MESLSDLYRKGKMDGVKTMMLGGSGPSARPGIAIIDSQEKLASEIASGIIEVMDKGRANVLLKSTQKKGSGIDNVNRPATGVVEMDALLDNVKKSFGKKFSQKIIDGNLEAVSRGNKEVNEG